MRNPNLLSGLLLCLTLAFTACTSADPTGTPDPDPARTPSPLEAYLIRWPWIETLPEGTVLFAGRSLRLDFEADSVLLEDAHFTDVADCRWTDTGSQCSDHSWTNTYRGAWTLQDNVIRIDFHFVGTTASPWTPNEIMGAARVEFAVPGSPWGMYMPLERTSPGEFLGSKREFRMVRPIECF